MEITGMFSNHGDHPGQQVLGFAVDAGSRASLLALRDWDRLTVASESGGQGIDWEAALAAGHFGMLISGTSDSAHGRELEAQARKLAVRNSMKVVVIEDFAGNFVPLADAPTDLLVVESMAAKQLNLRRWGALCPSVFVCGAVRYDGLRLRHAALRERQRKLRSAGRRRPTVLWAGQPETEHCVATLLMLLPALCAEGVVLLFKAHPRDPQRRSSCYRRLLARSGLTYVDVGDLSMNGVMAHAPDLVVTQFSSLAIEAGFHGIPSLLVLLPGHGGKLISNKGYAVPPWCMEGGAFHAATSVEIATTIRSCLSEDSARARIIQRFDEYFQVDQRSTDVLIDRLLVM